MYAYEMDVDRPIEQYDSIHAEVMRQRPALLEQCLLHLVTRTQRGFRIVEVWESHEAADRWGDEVMRPIVERVLGPDAVAGGPPPSTELDLHVMEVSPRTAAMAG